MKTKAIIHYPAVSMMLLIGCLYHNSIFAESFVLDSLPPVAVCQNVIVSADENCVGFVTADQVDNGSFDPEGDSLTYSLDPPAPYQLGETTVTLTVADSTGESDQCTATITVVDDAAPVITINPDVSIMWPPNHQYTTYELDDLIISVEDNCSELSLEDVNITKVTSDEAENSTGDGNTMDDIMIANDCKSIQLRAERQGSSNGRVYTIYLELDDDNDNTDSASYQIHVPHNTGNPAIDDGPAYEVNMECNDETTSVSDLDIEAINLSVYPNPFSNSTTFEYELNQASTVQIFIYNPVGKQVDVIRVQQAMGLNKTTWNPKNIPEGVYYFKIQAGDQKASGLVMLIK